MKTRGGSGIIGVDITDRQPGRLVVVKVGSGVLAPGGTLDERALGLLSRDLASLHAQGLRVVLVSSGAVAAGYRALGHERMPESIRDKQAAAAVGQPLLVAAYTRALAEAGVATAQVLLTGDDFEHRGRFLNARHTLGTLLERGVLPIVNENDSVAFEEIALGDNDRLSALVAAALGAEVLVMLSVAGGLLDGAGRVVERVEDLLAARALVRAERSATGRGGMGTKLDAAELAAAHDVPAVVAPGPSDACAAPVAGILGLGDAPPCTRFELGGVGRPVARKSWIGFVSRVRGRIVVDAGAAAAVRDRGASLLARGITGVEGGFDAGDCVEIVDADGDAVARGLSAYASDQIAQIRGLSSEDAAGALREAGALQRGDAVVHRDDLIVLRNGGG